MFACFTSYLTCHYISCRSLPHTVTYWHIRLHISREQPPFLPCWCLRNSKAGALPAIETAQPGVQFYSTEPSIHGRHFDSYIFIHLPSGWHSWLEYPGMKPIGYIHLHGDFCPAIYICDPLPECTSVCIHFWEVARLKSWFVAHQLASFVSVEEVLHPHKPRKPNKLIPNIWHDWVPLWDVSLQAVDTNVLLSNYRKGTPSLKKCEYIQHSSNFCV